MEAGLDIPKGLEVCPLMKAGRKRLPMGSLKRNSLLKRRSLDAQLLPPQLEDQLEEHLEEQLEEHLKQRAEAANAERDAKEAERVAARQLLKLNRQLDSRNASDGLVAHGVNAAAVQRTDVLAPVAPQLLTRDSECCLCFAELKFPCPKYIYTEGAWGYARCCGRYYHFDCVSTWVKTKNTSPVIPYTGSLAARNHGTMERLCPFTCPVAALGRGGTCQGCFDGEARQDGVKWTSARSTLVLGMRECDEYRPEQ